MSVLQFPADRRLAEVKRCAARLNNLHGGEADQFWRAEMFRFVAILEAAGAVEEEVRQQAGLFLQAVQVELQLMAVAG